MGVGRTQRQSLRLNPSFFLQPSRYFISYARWHAGVIDRDQYRRFFLVATDRNGFGIKMLEHPLGFFLAHRVTTEPDGVIRRNIDFGRADLAKRFGFRSYGF